MRVPASRESGERSKLKLNIETEWGDSQASAVKTCDQVRNTLSFHTDVRREYVVANGEGRGNDEHFRCMQKGRECRTGTLACRR